MNSLLPADQQATKMLEPSMARASSPLVCPSLPCAGTPPLHTHTTNITALTLFTTLTCNNPPATLPFVQQRRHSLSFTQRYNIHSFLPPSAKSNHKFTTHHPFCRIPHTVIAQDFWPHSSQAIRQHTHQPHLASHFNRSSASLVISQASDHGLPRSQGWSRPRLSRPEERRPQDGPYQQATGRRH